MSAVTHAVSEDESALAEVVARAKEGDRLALERVVRAIQDDVFRLSLRMTACRMDAEDAAQEILVKIITRLDGFRAESSLKTWVYRIAAHHLLDRKKSRVESQAVDFARFGDDLLDGLAAEPAPDPLLANEVKLGCTLAMLTCLDREHRLAYILGDVFDLDNASAALVCDVTEETYRQRLSRSRRALEAFTTSYCGLVNRDAPCACPRRVAKALELGRIQRSERREEPSARIAQGEMESLHETARLMRSHPEYTAPASLIEGVRAVIGRAGQLLR
jgi:RNA polymerase sigma factor (sigma-70 family)